MISPEHIQKLVILIYTHVLIRKPALPSDRHRVNSLLHVWLSAKCFRLSGCHLPYSWNEGNNRKSGYLFWSLNENDVSQHDKPAPKGRHCLKRGDRKIVRDRRWRGLEWNNAFQTWQGCFIHELAATLADSRDQATQPSSTMEAEAHQPSS